MARHVRSLHIILWDYQSIRNVDWWIFRHLNINFLDIQACLGTCSFLALLLYISWKFERFPATRNHSGSRSFQYCIDLNRQLINRMDWIDNTSVFDFLRIVILIVMRELTYRPPMKTLGPAILVAQVTKKCTCSLQSAKTTLKRTIILFNFEFHLLWNVFDYNLIIKIINFILNYSKRIERFDK